MTEDDLFSKPAETAAPTGGRIYQAIADIMAEVGAIGKTKRNEQQKYNFRGIDDVYNRVHPLLAKHGVFSTSEVLEHKREQGQSGKGTSFTYSIIHQRWSFIASDGSRVFTDVIGEGMDYGGDKASNKAMSAGHKYAICQILCIPVEAIDPDHFGPPIHENPDMKADAPKAAPRGERVNGDDLKALFAKWKTCNRYLDDADAAAKFRLWIFQTTGIVQDDANKPEKWTKQQLRTCQSKIAVESGEPA